MKLIKEASKDDNIAAERKAEREIQTETEKKIKKRIIKNLRDDGEGHHHAKYAARLEGFPLKIVPRSVDPKMTAAISWDDVTIYVSDGFITRDKDAYKQLNVLMRHELAHYLMQHELRMAKKFIDKYGDESYQRFKTSYSFHDLLNIIEDFEISNKRYTDADKELVKNLILGGRVIHGLVTEDMRMGWEKLSLEDMYENLEKEIARIQQSILAKWDALDMGRVGNRFDMIDRTIVDRLQKYSDINHPTNFFGPLSKFLKNKALYHFAPFDGDDGSMCIAKYSLLPDYYQNIIELIADEFTEGNGYTKQDLRDRVIQIGKSKSLDPISLMTNKNKELMKLYTPEEKFLAIDCLKARIPELEEYNTWYEKVIKTLSDSKYSDADRQKIFDAINK